MQKEGYKGLTSLGREKPCKKNGGKWQKNLIEALTESYRERKFWKLLKSKFEHVKIRFEKTLYKIFDWSKIRFDWSKMLRLIQYQSSIDWNKQRLTKDFNCNFDWLKNRFDRLKVLWLIQHQLSIDQNTQSLAKILIAILIGRETGSIDRNSGKNNFLKKQSNFL